jgi:endonuclease/exonuclease/phosphatase family metal-dependent hydrolase
MKLLTLNIWGGIVYEPLVSLIDRLSGDVDIFCFQEVLFGSEAATTPVHKARINIFNELVSRLPDFVDYVYPVEASINAHFQSEPISGFSAGQAIFVRKSLSVIGNGGFRAYQVLPLETDNGGKITGSCQWIDIQTENGPVTVLNLHGLWQKGRSKLDTPERLLQSQIIHEFFAARTGGKILCGDFNLVPDGQSMTILEQGMKNLVKEYGITSTRSSYYKETIKFADYILVSPEIKIKDFKVLPDEVSDHLSLLVEF